MDGTGKKNLVLFTNAITAGGAERVVSRLSFELAKKYNLYIFLINNGKTFYDCAGTIVVVGGGKKNYRARALYAAMHFGSYLRQYHIDCVISFLDVPNLINATCNRECTGIVSIRDCAPNATNLSLTEKVKFLLCQATFKKAAAVIPAAEEMKGIVIERFQLEPSRVHAIQNPYGVSEIAKDAQEQIEPEILNFIQAHRTAVAVGRLTEQKGYDDLIAAFAQVVSRVPDAGLLILGKGELYDEIKNDAKQRMLGSNVLLAGVRENPFRYMSKCMTYVSASRHEGFPNTLVEAMACGLPVIQTDCMTGPREILSDGSAKYGILVPSYMRMEVAQEQMIEQLSEAWINILENESLRKEYAEKAQKRAEKFSMESCIDKYCSVIERYTVMENKRK